MERSERGWGSQVLAIFSPSLQEIPGAPDTHPPPRVGFFAAMCSNPKKRRLKTVLLVELRREPVVFLEAAQSSACLL